MAKKIDKLVNLYKPDSVPQIPELEKTALYKLFESAGKDPKDYYNPDHNSLNNLGDIKVKNNHIISIYAPAFGLKRIPRSIVNLKSLRYLNLFGNEIKTIPKKIRDLNSLEELFLLKNPLNKKSKKLLEKLEKKGIEVIYE